MPSLTDRLDALERSNMPDMQRAMVFIVWSGAERADDTGPQSSRFNLLRQPDETWDALSVRVTAQFPEPRPVVVFIPHNERG